MLILGSSDALHCIYSHTYELWLRVALHYIVVKIEILLVFI